MFVSYANQNDLYDALEKIGAKPGNNVTMDNMGKEAVKGDKIDLTFKFQGSDNEQGINDVIKDSSGKEIDIRFGGNQKPAKDMNTLEIQSSLEHVLKIAKVFNKKIK